MIYLTATFQQNDVQNRVKRKPILFRRQPDSAQRVEESLAAFRKREANHMPD